MIVAQISYAVPAAILIYRRRSSDFLPPSRTFKMPDWLGYVANAVCIIWAVVITVFFTFPTVFPVTGGNMSMSSFPRSLRLRDACDEGADIDRLCECRVGRDGYFGGFELGSLCEAMVSWA